ncbi:hypothetical protein DICPUDRAFT_147258 [Dictyostelium purpureum]|uniref:Uncharacterized protein n=1 Tax=Dictyostelium purpureum TaxID=5786 RepID=F0Z821_DICPU|nr:uncharacterized protein DICPUDRAFT_147258 [Dictyostelium purpureum]EGC39914.1 hypothetical protein DICPUDRAFT_147258 [Dictyostelium purpureum]|eukprot:XP_003283543.1 hypothetical protein DICPUDRAFT_147258 [Dictyostelium purpureum]
MKLVLSLLLLFSTIINYCVGVIITPSTPGGIDTDQINVAPIASVYGSVSYNRASNGIQLIVTICEALKNNLNAEYYPLMILNSTAYFARQLNSNALNLAIVTSQGIHPLEIQPNLMKLGVAGNIQSEISYDDTIGEAGSFIFADKNGNIVIYDIFKDVVKSIDFLTAIEFNTPPYYNYNSKLYYISTFDSSSSQSILVANFEDYSTNFYSVANLNLPHSIDSIYTSGYNNQIVLFGSNNEDQKSYLYLMNPNNGSYKFLGSKDFNTTMITGLNSQYVLFENQEGTLTELLNLQTLTSQNYKNTCFDIHYLNIFLTSIIPKDIFTN